MQFFVSDWSSTLRCSECIGEKEIFVIVRNDSYKIFCRDNIPSCVEAPEICSNQEQADTKTFLCAAFALTLGFNSVVAIDTPGYHAVTGCDYTSSFHGLGKTKGLKFLKDNLSF